MSAAPLPRSAYRASTTPGKRVHKRCRKCGKVVSVKALVCRRCGKRQRVNPRTLYLMLAGSCIAAMFGVATVGSLRAAGRASYLAQLPRSAETHGRAFSGPPEPVRLGAADLWAAYNHDAVAADHMYKDKRVIVTGRLMVTPTRDFLGHVVLRLGTEDVFEMVHATLARRDTLIDSFPAKGQTVTVACVGRGAVIGAPLLGGCVLQ